MPQDSYSIDKPIADYSPPSEEDMIIPLSGDRRDFRQCIGTASNPGKEASTEIKVVQRGQLFGENVSSDIQIEVYLKLVDCSVCT